MKRETFALSSEHPPSSGNPSLLKLPSPHNAGTQLLPGLVHYSQLLPLQLQQSLLDVACCVTSRGEDSQKSAGWYRYSENAASPILNDGTKARFWDEVNVFPEGVAELGKALATLVGSEFPQTLGKASESFQPRVVSCNFYTMRGRMNWHADDYNFAKPERPIIMASLGDSADFGYKLKASDADRSVVLKSGDVLVFGGPARDLVHALLRVHPNTSPPLLDMPNPPGKGRISITWRDVGPEDGLTFNSDERLGLVVSENTLSRYLPKTGSGYTPIDRWKK